MIIFTVVVYFAINYFSRSKSYLNIPVPDVLGETVKYLPPQSRNALQHLDTSPVVKFVQDEFSTIQKMSGDFPQKQITEVKKMVVNQIYQNVMKSIDGSAK